MPDKEVDEQFAAIMAHWQDEATGQDPFGDPLPGLEDLAPDGPAAPAASAPDAGADPMAEPSRSEATPGYDLPFVTGRPDTPEPLEEEPIDSSDPSPVGSAWRQHTPPEVEPHFEPPPPAPLPSSEDRHFWTMLGSLVGGPLLFLYLLLFNRDGNGWWMTFAILVSIAGFVLLVLRQPAERDEDDDGIRL